MKAAHLNSIPGLKDYAIAFSKAWGPDGALKKQGMVVAPEGVRTTNAAIAQAMTLLDPTTLK